MREVQRLPDRIVLHWIQLDRITYDQWIRLKLDSDERQAKVLDYRIMDVPATVDPRHEKQVTPFKPPGVGWYFKGAEGLPGGQEVHTFNTPSKNLEPGDVWVGADEVMWCDPTDAMEQRAPIAEVTIARDGTNVISKVTRKAGRTPL